MDVQFYLQYGSIAILFIVGGIAVRIYLKRTGLDDFRRILGLNVYWLKLYATFVIIMGSIGLIAILTTLYFELKLEGIL